MKSCVKCAKTVINEKNELCLVCYYKAKQAENDKKLHERRKKKAYFSKCVRMRKKADNQKRLKASRNAGRSVSDSKCGHGVIPGSATAYARTARPGRRCRLKAAAVDALLKKTEKS